MCAGRSAFGSSLAQLGQAGRVVLTGQLLALGELLVQPAQYAGSFVPCRAGRRPRRSAAASRSRRDHHRQRRSRRCADPRRSASWPPTPPSSAASAYAPTAAHPITYRCPKVSKSTPATRCCCSAGRSSSAYGANISASLVSGRSDSSNCPLSAGCHGFGCAAKSSSCSAASRTASTSASRSVTGIAAGDASSTSATSSVIDRALPSDSQPQIGDLHPRRARPRPRPRRHRCARHRPRQSGTGPPAAARAGSTPDQGSPG